MVEFMNKNEKGFGAVGGLLALLIVALVGVIGYTVYNAQNKSESKSSASSDTPTVSKPNNDSKETAAKAETKWLLQYTSQNKKFFVYVPDGWRLGSTLNYDTLFAWNSSDIQFKEGTKAEVQTFVCGTSTMQKNYTFRPMHRKLKATKHLQLYL